jgi:putative membrane protein
LVHQPLLLTYLPSLNAFLNATSAILLVTGYRFIRQRNVRAHRACMIAAFTVSVLFLLSYLTYHYYAGTTRFPGQGGVRLVYFAILISHTALAVLVPFLAVITLFRAVKEQFPRHRWIARWTLPIWLYVSVTGVVVYLMLYHLYPPA